MKSRRVMRKSSSLYSGDKLFSDLHFELSSENTFASYMMERLDTVGTVNQSVMKLVFRSTDGLVCHI